MERSNGRILTTHVGSLPRPSDLIAQYQANAPASTLEPHLKSAVRDVVKQQIDAGIDVVNDGEYGKAMRAPVDYGAWWSYIYARMEGFTPKPGGPESILRLVKGSKDRADFMQFCVEHGGMGQAAQQAEQTPEGEPPGSGASTASARVHRASHVHRARAHQTRHRRPQGGAHRDQSRRSVHDCGLASNAADPA